MLDNERNLMNLSYVLQRFITPEKALERVQKSVADLATRASAEFKSTLQKATVNELSPVVKYLPVYHLNTSGSYEWSETSYHTAGNALIGDVLFTTEQTKSKNASSSFIVDKSSSYGIFVNAQSYKEDNRKIFSKIENEQALNLPVFYPLLTVKEMANEITRNANKKHKGSYSLSDLSILLVMVPVMQFTFVFEGQKYLFYVNLYSGEADTLDVDTAPAIEAKFAKLEKLHNIFKFAKYGLLGLMVFDFILAIIIKGGELGGVDKASYIVVWVLLSVISGLLIFLPRKKQLDTWETLEDEYTFDDSFIKDNGQLRFKAIVHIGVDVIQVAVTFFFVFFITVMSLQ